MRHTDETKRKLSEMRKGEKNPFYGKKHSPETKAKIAQWTREFNASRQYELNPLSITIPIEPDLSYIAGIVDGEGSIRFHRERPFIAIYNTDTRLMDWLQKKLGGHVNSHNVGGKGRLPMYAWNITATHDVYCLANILLPRLIVKFEDAQEIIDFLEKKYGKERLNG